MSSTTAVPSEEAIVAGLNRLAEYRSPDIAADVVTEFVRVEGPLEPIYVAFGRRGVRAIEPATPLGDDAERFREHYRARFRQPIVPARDAPAGLVTALRTGRRGQVAVDLRGLSEFEQAVLEKALEIPYGEIRPYNWIAGEIGRPKAVRAVGSALGRNPIPFLIPCHRVVRTDGMIGNYGYGGTPMKRRLLANEGLDLEEVHALAKAAVRFVGSSTTRIFCFPSCHDARRITTSRRVSFASFQDALEADYRPCLHCRPSASLAA